MTDDQSVDAAFRRLVETAGCMIVILRADHTIEYFNPFAETITGYSADEVMGKDYFAIFLDEDAHDGVATEIKRILAGGEPTRGHENPVKCHDGRLRWMAWNAQRLDDYHGQPAVLAVGHDITELRNASEEIRNQEAQLRAVLDTAVDGIITINNRGIVQSFNPAAERIFGYAADEVIGQNVSTLMPAPYRNEHDGYIANYLTTGDAKIIGIGREAVGLRKDGSTFPLDLAVSEMHVDDARMFTGIVRDITERKQVEETLIERENFLQTIFDTEPECVKLLSPGGMLQHMNRAGLEMIEANSLEEVKGKCIYPVVVPEHREAFQQFTDRVFQGESGTLDFEIVGQKGTRRRLNTHAVPLRNQKGEITALLGITRDITEQKHAEERALQAERLAAIGQTVTGLAHESRNAFQRSQACLEMLAIELEGRQAELELVQRVQKALDHLHHLYEEVRDYAAPINLDRQVCDLSHLWRDAWSHLEVVRKGKRIELREETGNVDLSCDVDWFATGQVFRNILENATEVCPNPGEIVIRCIEAVIDESPAVAVSVQDNGPGFESDARERVFDAFFTTKTKGTGLGMAIARRIVEAHGGTIAVGDASPGAEIIITLPRKP